MNGYRFVFFYASSSAFNTRKKNTDTLSSAFPPGVIVVLPVFGASDNCYSVLCKHCLLLFVAAIFNL